MTDPQLRAALTRAASSPHLTHLIAQARVAAKRPMPRVPTWSLYRLYQDTGNRRRYERAYFARRGHLNARALANLADDSARTRERLADALWSTCDEWTWALPAHAWLAADTDRDMPRCVDLFASESAHTLAEMVTLFGDRLPQPVTDRVRAEIHRRVLDPYFGDARPWPWESARHNWSAVCAGAAAMAALALWPDGEHRLRSAVDRCRTALAAYLSGLGRDGGCAEGLDYWVYGFGYFTYFAEALRERTGEDLLGGELAAAAAGFPAATQLAPGRFVTFSDACEHPMLPPGLLHRLSERLDVPQPTVAAVPDLAADHCHRWAHLSRNLAWTDPSRLGEDAPPSGGSWLADLAWLVDRRTVAGVPVAFAAKGGHNDEPHNHNDLGHFILAVNGDQVLVDLGAGEYRAGYFHETQRYRFLHPSAQAHSVPIVDGHVQRPGRCAAATVRSLARHAHGADLALDLSAAYGGAQVHRAFAWRAGSLTLTDEFAAAARVEELFISRTPPAVTAGAVTWHGAGVASMRFDPASWQPTVERIDTRDHHGAPQTVHRLRLRSLRPPGTARFEFTLG